MNKVIGLAMLDTILVILGGISEQVFYGATETSRLSKLIFAPQFSQSVAWYLQVGDFFAYTWEYVKNFMGMVTFDYPMLNQGNWLFLKYILFMPIGIGIVFMIVSLIRGVRTG